MNLKFEQDVMETARSASGGISWEGGQGGSHLCYILQIKQVTTASPDPKGRELDSTSQ